MLIERVLVYDKNLKQPLCFEFYALREFSNQNRSEHFDPSKQKQAFI